MAIRKATRAGKVRWFIDIRYTDTSGRQRRFRKDATSQTKTGAQAEERRLRHQLAKSGTLTPAKPHCFNLTFYEAIELWRRVEAPHKKHSTVVGYEARMVRLQSLFKLKVRAIDARDVRRLDAELIEVGLTKNTRNGIHITLRAVLKCCVAEGHLEQMPELPPLKTERQIRDPMTAEDVERLLGSLKQNQALAMGLMAYAGLREEVGTKSDK